MRQAVRAILSTLAMIGTLTTMSVRCHAEPVGQVFNLPTETNELLAGCKPAPREDFSPLPRIGECSESAIVGGWSARVSRGNGLPEFEISNAGWKTALGGSIAIS